MRKTLNVTRFYVMCAAFPTLVAYFCTYHLSEKEVLEEGDSSGLNLGFAAFLYIMVLIYAPMMTFLALALDLLKINSSVLNKVLYSMIFFIIPLLCQFFSKPLLEAMKVDVSYMTGCGGILDLMFVYAAIAEFIVLLVFKLYPIVKNKMTRS